MKQEEKAQTGKGWTLASAWRVCCSLSLVVVSGEQIESICFLPAVHAPHGGAKLGDKGYYARPPTSDSRWNEHKLERTQVESERESLQPCHSGGQGSLLCSMSTSFQIFPARLGGATSFPSPDCFPKAETAWGWHCLSPQLPYFKPALHPTMNTKWIPLSFRALLPGSHCHIVFDGRCQRTALMSQPSSWAESWNVSLKISSLPVWPRERQSPALQIIT